MHVWVHDHTSIGLYIYMHVYMHTCMYECLMYVSMYVCMYLCLCVAAMYEYAFMLTCKYECVYVDRHAWMFMCIDFNWTTLPTNMESPCLYMVTGMYLISLWSYSCPQIIPNKIIWNHSEKENFKIICMLCTYIYIYIYVHDILWR